MLSFEEIYNETPFEDEYGELIPHDKVAKMAALQFGRHIIMEICDRAKNDINIERPLTANSINDIYSEAIMETLKLFNT